MKMKPPIFAFMNYITPNIIKQVNYFPESHRFDIMVLKAAFESVPVDISCKLFKKAFRVSS